MAAIVAFVPLFIITWLFCIFAALLLSKYISNRPLWLVLCIWIVAVLLLLVLLVNVGFVGSAESDWHLYLYLALPIMMFPPLISLLVARESTFLRHLAVAAGSFALAVPVASIWLLLFI